MLDIGAGCAGTAGDRRARADPPSGRARTEPAMGVVLVGLAVILLVLAPAAVALPVTVALLVVAGVIARHLLADLAAGATLLLAQPYRHGERVRLLTTDRGQIEAEIMRVRLLQTALCTAGGVLVVRNRDLLRTTGS